MPVSKTPVFLSDLKYCLRCNSYKGLVQKLHGTLDTIVSNLGTSEKTIALQHGT